MEQATLTPPVINFKKERNFSEKLNATFAFLSQNFRPMAKNLLLIAGPFALLTGIFYGIYQTYATGGSFSPAGPNPAAVAGNMFFIFMGLGLMMLFSFIATALVVAIVMRHIKVYIAEGHANISTGHLWSSIWGDFFRVLGTTFYIGVLFFFSIMLLAIPILLSSLSRPNPVVIGLVMFFGFFGLMFFWPVLLLLFPIRSMERINVFSATGRLFKLAAGKWLSTVGLVIVVSVIHFVMSIAFAIPMYIIMFMNTMHSLESEMPVEPSFGLNGILLTLSTGFSMLGSFALYSILFIALTFQYFNLLEKKEAKGLLERMEGFGKPKTDSDDHKEQY